MQYITLLVMLAVLSAAVLACHALVRWMLDVRAARRDFRDTVEGLSIRAHQAARAERERARESSEVAEAGWQITRQAAEVQHTLALERKLRKAIGAPLPPPLPRSHRNPTDSGASA